MQKCNKPLAVSVLRVLTPGELRRAGRAIWWDQQHLPALFPHAALITDPSRRALLDRVMARFTERVVPAFPRLRSQVIHNDVTRRRLAHR